LGLLLNKYKDSKHNYPHPTSPLELYTCTGNFHYKTSSNFFSFQKKKKNNKTKRKKTKTTEKWVADTENLPILHSL